MKKTIAAFNLTLDAFCDHTAVDPDEEVHDHYSELLKNASVALYGRKTFELMKYWQQLLENPSEEKSMNDFAAAMDRIPKLVFSNTLKDTGWNTARLAAKPIEEELKELKQQDGKDILVGSRSLIVQLTNLNLIDEYQLCIHPVVIGKGLPLFDEIRERTSFKLLKTKTFKSGALILYYSRS